MGAEVRLRHPAPLLGVARRGGKSPRVFPAFREVFSCFVRSGGRSWIRSGGSGVDDWLVLGGFAANPVSAARVGGGWLCWCVGVGSG